jgi:hypothetical protein
MSAQSALMKESPIAVFDWIDTHQLSDVVANFARIHILIALFDGDPDKWLRMLEQEGTPQECASDVPFLIALKERMKDDPGLLAHFRRVMLEFSVLVAGTPLPA